MKNKKNHKKEFLWSTTKSDSSYSLKRRHIRKRITSVGRP